MKKLTSAIKFVGLFALLIFSLYFMNIFTSSTISANSETSENYAMKVKYYELQNEINIIKDNLTKINYYDKNIYASVNGVTLDSSFLIKNDFNIDFDKLTNDSIFSLIESQSFQLSQMVANELTNIRNTSKEIGMAKNYPNISPIRTRDFIMVTSPFGWRKHPIFKTGMFHDGIDISGRIGSPVYSTADGVVDFVLYSKYGYGNRIVIKHKNGYETLYAHLGKDIRVKKGYRIKKGDRIGSIGNSGRSTGAHLHYEIRHNDELQDPLAYFYTYLTDELLAKNNSN